MADFLHMGGYAAFVWPAYLLTGFIMFGLLVRVVVEMSAQKRLLAELEGDGKGRLRAPARPPRDRAENR